MGALEAFSQTRTGALQASAVIQRAATQLCGEKNGAECSDKEGIGCAAERKVSGDAGPKLCSCRA
jgi:hypothetical protein